ncbi:MAG: FG-GAP-like repeat-containing protein [Methylobacterium sp.]|uniref:FG-GAP-like repeat-containing protein n=1 Tax=Methylobacterium sp. TaxID=409 RepID=UPI0025870542|nr:FG-GAP-like repeat-containing protein [Methylobacterium sp.]MBY0299787.1 FG-GAP-like repeat-containing protein [Methylobacterium sp.]
MVGYVLEGPRWGAGALGTGAGPITWSIDASVPAQFVPTMTAAFDGWARYGNIRFQSVASTSPANIRVTYGAIDGPGNVAGRASYSYTTGANGSTFTSATVIFDNAENWDSSRFRFVVALHEIGHAIGLGHYEGEPAIMNSTIPFSINDLTASDIAGVQALYGPATVRTVAVTNDFNGDGRSDILWRDTSPSFFVSTWQMNANGQPGSMPRIGQVGPAWVIQGTGDFNGDGRSDILWRDSNGYINTWQMNANGQRGATPTIGQVGAAWVIQGTGDFNGDGRSDILWRHADGYINTWLMDANGQVANAPNIAQVGSSWQVAGTGDFNGDGRSDILWRDTSGYVNTWLMDGNGQVASAPNIGQVGSSWQVADTGDYNGDRITDILWRDTSGYVNTWLMNSNGQISSAPNIGIVGPSWSIA